MQACIKRHGGRLALLLVAVILLTATVWAGSAKVYFGWSFNASPSINTSRAYKSDAGSSSGNYASVYVESFYGLNDGVSFEVRSIDGNAVTGSRRVTGVCNFNLIYEESVTNGYLYLHGTSNIGNGGLSGCWYP